MGKCYQKIQYEYLEVNKRNAKKVLQVLGFWDNTSVHKSLGFITYKELDELHKNNKRLGVYKYGYYDAVRHKLIYGYTDRTEYDEDDYGSLYSYIAKPEEFSLPCGVVVIYRTNSKGEYVLHTITDKDNFVKNYIKEVG